MLGFHGPSLVFSKKHYETNPSILAEYAKSVAEMQQVLRTGKTIKEAPLDKETGADLVAFGKRVVDFEKYLSKRIPDAELQRNLTVSGICLNLNSLLTHTVHQLLYHTRRG
jgi:hypothetical protein